MGETGVGDVGSTICPLAPLQTRRHRLRNLTSTDAIPPNGLSSPVGGRANPTQLVQGPPFCNDALTLEPAWWTFLFVEGVEPTNNAAEHAALRLAVLWRKGCFGSRSQAGPRFTEAILTVTDTCRQQQRPFLPFLTDTPLLTGPASRLPPFFINFYRRIVQGV